MSREPAARAARTDFALDRERFARATREELGALEGMFAGWEGGVAAALSSRLDDAREAGAIIGPPGLELIAYAVGDSVIVAVREEEPPWGLPVALRQLATYSFETKYVFNPEDESFEEACEAIEELLGRASALLASFEAMRRGERALDRDGRRRPFPRLRALPRAFATGEARAGIQARARAMLGQVAQRREKAEAEPHGPTAQTAASGTALQGSPIAHRAPAGTASSLGAEPGPGEPR